MQFKVALKTVTLKHVTPFTFFGPLIKCLLQEVDLWLKGDTLTIISENLINCPCISIYRSKIYELLMKV